jgi:AcrR family transcriptional regulator
MARTAAGEAPRWTRLERDERREQILDCARVLFSERNYPAVSMGEIADSAGVARGLLHHYFGTKRDLYLEVVREMVRIPPPVAEDAGGRPVEEVVAEGVERWLTMVKRNRGTWLAAIGAEGFGRDPELERVLDDAREAVAERVIELLGPAVGGTATDELRATIRAFGGMAEAATREWLESGRLTRGQVHVLLTDTLLAMVHDVLPRLERR